MNKSITQACGLEATIIKEGANDFIDVVFSNGVERINVKRSEFEAGLLTFGELHKGEIRRQNCGLNAEIVVFTSPDDICIQFSDGRKLNHKSYEAFVAGLLAPLDHCRLGKEVVQNDGRTAKCVAYRSWDDVDVLFENEANPVKTAWSTFLNGEVGEDVKPLPLHLGERRRMNNGIFATVVNVRPNFRVDVEFDNGVLRENMQYSQFKNCQIGLGRGGHVGVEKLQKCGKTAKCIAYRTTASIDVMFEDGTLVRNISWGQFTAGKVSYEGEKKTHKKYKEFSLRCSRKELLRALAESDDDEIVIPLSVTKGVARIKK